MGWWPGLADRSNEKRGWAPGSSQWWGNSLNAPVAKRGKKRRCSDRVTGVHSVAFSCSATPGRPDRKKETDSKPQRASKQKPAAIDHQESGIFCRFPVNKSVEDALTIMGEKTLWFRTVVLLEDLLAFSSSGMCWKTESPFLFRSVTT